MSLEQAPGFVKQLAPTRDAFLGGRIVVSQPASGFRAGLDSVLLGAAVRPGPGAVLDLGAGVGTAALVALANATGRTATLVEADADMAALAALNLQQNGFAERGRVVTLDVGAPGKARTEAGLATDHFATVIANPPWFDPALGTAPAASRAGARHMPGSHLALWLRTALAHAAPGGEIIFVHAAEALPHLLTEMQLKIGRLTVMPLVPRSGEPATRVLVRGIKGSRAPFRLLASRPLHQAEGRHFTASFEAIFRGEATLDW